MKPTWAKSDSESVSSYRLDDLIICPSRRAVLRDGSELPLGKLTFDLLVLLVEAAPDLVSHEELTRRLWADRVVTEDTVRQRIKLLRKALSDSSRNPRYFSVVRGQGIRLIPKVERVSADRAPVTPRRQWLPVSAAVIVMLAAAATVLWLNAPAGPSAAPDNRSIAVLPFEILSTEPDDALFVDGFYNDLLTQLAGIEDLKVISRTSVIEYRDKPKSIRTIGRELGVATILEGSVQRSGGSVRINAQLIDATDDRHLWAQAYNREITAENTFAIQAEMADAITEALQVQLTDSETARIHDAPTASPRAYNHYLMGQNFITGNLVRDGLNRAVEAFENAVDEDPGFALAWASLALTQSKIYFFREQSEDRRNAARGAVERALNLQPDLPEAHLALGFVRFHTERDYDGALAAWEVAEHGMPGDHRLFQARAAVYGRIGDTQRSIDNWERAVELDPRNADKRVSLAWQLALVGDYDRSRELLRDVVVLAPDKPAGYARLAFIPLWRDGDGRGLQNELDSAPFSVRTFPMEWLAAIYERDFEAAFGILEQWPADGVDTPLVYRPKDWFYGATLKLSGDPDRADQHYRSAMSRIEELLARRPYDLRLKITLADIKANLGERDDAIGLANEVLTALPKSLDASLGPNFQLYAIKVFLAAGEYETAIDELDAYLSSPSVWAIEGLLPDPRLDPIREHPKFVELVRRHARI